MGPMDNMNIELNQRVRLRKAHPCGGFEWRVVRLGADIGLECDTCGRRVLLTRRELAKRIQLVLDRKSTRLNSVTGESRMPSSA